MKALRHTHKGKHDQLEEAGGGFSSGSGWPAGRQGKSPESKQDPKRPSQTSQL